LEYDLPSTVNSASLASFKRTTDVDFSQYMRWYYFVLCYFDFIFDFSFHSYCIM